MTSTPLSQPGFCLSDAALPGWLLVRGTIELYAQPHHDGVAAGPRRFLGLLAAGSVLPRLASHPGWRIWVVPMAQHDVEPFHWPGAARAGDDVPPLDAELAARMARNFAPLLQVMGAISQRCPPAPAMATLLREGGAGAQLRLWCAVCCDWLEERRVPIDMLDSAPANAEARQAALWRMVGVLDPRAREETGGGQGEVRLYCAVAQAQGISLPAGADQVTAGASLAQWAHHANIRLRRVALRDDWWRRSGTPLLATREADGAPLALLPRPQGGYQWRDAAGAGGVVGEREAGQLRHFAHSFHGRLPDQPLALLELLRFGWRGALSDIRTMLAASLTAGGLGAMTPAAVGYVFQSVIPVSELGLLASFAAVIAVLALAKGMLKLTSDLASLRIEGRLGNGLQSAFFDRMLRLPLDFYASQSSGDLANRLTTVDMVRRSFAGVAVALSTSLFYTAGAFGTMLYFMPKAAWIAGTQIVLLWGLAAWFGWRQVRVLFEGEQIEGNMAALAVQLIQGVPKLRLAGAEDRAFGLWGRGFAQMRARLANSRRVQINFQVVVVVAEVLLSATVYVVLGYADGDKPSTSEFLALVAALTTFTSGGMALAQAIMAAISLRPFMERLRPIMNARPDAPAHAGAEAPLSGALEVSRATFTYRGQAGPVLRNVSFKVTPGQFVAVIGASGSGKSTLLRLLLGFEQPDAGGIYYDGNDLHSLNPASVRRQIGVVLQNGRAMAGSLFENIAVTHECTHDEVWEAVRLAGLEDDVRAMPMGLHTILSEGNATLSGGQVQRLLLARALAGKPKLLMLDEATSALDNRTQAVITEALNKMAVTRIVIAHRLSTVMQADQILVLHNGEIVERGTYDELVALGGHFTALAKRQLL